MTRNKWSEEELTIMIENYSSGLNNICKLLKNHTRNSIAKKAKELKLQVDKYNLYYDINDVKLIVKESYSFAEVVRKLKKTKSGDTYKSIKRFIERNNIDVSHFDPYRNNRFSNIEIPLSDYLMVGTSITSSNLKEKLYKHNLKERICEKCGQTEDWYGEKMSLILDHINGINNDNRLENLRILCPNCNSTLPTHCRGFGGFSNEQKKYYCDCGNEKSKKSKRCFDCSSKLQRIVERPNSEKLLEELSESNYKKLGEKYGVSDNTIRKWLK